MKNPQETNSELEAALERTVSKAAIAIARLCLDSNMASNVVRLGGLDRLVRVTRLEIWHSENISIAIMAAIRTIMSFDYHSQVDLGHGPCNNESFV